MSPTICMIPGDGIGPEVLEAARTVLTALGVTSFIEAEAGWATFERTGTALPAATLAAVQAADATLFGAVSSPSARVAGYQSPIVALRRTLDLYACLRPIEGPLARANGRPVRLAVVRENTEGLYSGIEERDAERATTTRVITAAASARIAAWAVAYARAQGLRRITLVHKANVLRATCGLFREAALAVLADAPDLAVDELLVDTAAYQLARNPERFEVILTTNLFGDILSDLASAFGGGLGLAASANYGPRSALFEPVHGSAPDIAGRGIANPLATLRAAALMLDHLRLVAQGRRLRTAIDAVLRNGPYPPDLGGAATTAEVTAAVLNELNAQ